MDITLGTSSRGWVFDTAIQSLLEFQYPKALPRGFVVMPSEGTAVIDASIVYGANRILQGVHENPNWPWHAEYKKLFDKKLFREFLHLILLYDRIFLDHSSFTASDGTQDPIGNEIDSVLQAVNENLGQDLFEITPLTGNRIVAHESAEITCLLFAERLRKDSSLLERAKKISVPWYYMGKNHFDYHLFMDLAINSGLDLDLIPAAIFSYRGLAYAGYTHSLALDQDLPAAYVASPGRMDILELLLDEKDIETLSFARKQYVDLLDGLGLPRNGYNFTRLSSLSGVASSPLSVAIVDLSPADALEQTMELRRKPEGESLREGWAKRIWDEAKSVAVGPGVSQSVENVTVGGDFIQQITLARAA